ncbi:MAG: DUF2634 domain-containing protein [Bacteroidales bacterium]|nr:DUF2634 domain-containing protein [Bacteroidales bacterium]
MTESNFLSLPIDTIEEAEEAPSLTYKLDLNSGRIAGRIDGIEAVRQAIRKRIITPRFKCLIYSKQYGSEIEQAYIADGSTTIDFIEATIEAYIKDALLPDTRIVSCYDFAVVQEEDRVYISFKCDTAYGETTIEEVI